VRRAALWSRKRFFEGFEPNGCDGMAAGDRGEIGFDLADFVGR
jgi:hypothetical protein